LLACGGGILGLRIRDSTFERCPLLFRADGGDVFVVEDAIRGARRDERVCKLTLQFGAAFIMPDEEFD